MKESTKQIEDLEIDFEDQEEILEKDRMFKDIYIGSESLKP